MAKWKKQSHCVYQCKYHLVWCPKYRYRVLTGDVGSLVEESLRSLCEWKKIEVLELNVQPDHVHLVLQIPPRVSVSVAVGILKGKTAIKLFKSFPGLKKKPYWGNHFWARGYCVTTIGMDEEKIRRYVKYQEANEKREEGDERDFGLF
jgi:putative transposase